MVSGQQNLCDLRSGKGQIPGPLFTKGLRLS